ncbi:MFS transporter [Sphingomonas bacterium]|uniref:MFS transporter n=1 Tax=Sphingomonas bacterium TaxID=1895847 RepID=UPI0015767742|nr:MFS transporter [Sphingomonas bacterium]
MNSDGRNEPFIGEAPPLTRRLKLAYGVGSMAEAIVYSSTTQFLLLFYNQVRGLSAGGVGVALAAGLAVNAVIDPLVGSWSDRTRSRWGRRHPFMFAAILPVALTLFGLFNPPSGLPAWAELGWLGLLYILLQQALTVFHTPHLAMGGELTPDYIERTQVMSYNTFFLWAGDTFCWLASFGLFFAATARFPNGALDPGHYLRFSTVIALLVGTILFASAFFTRSRIPWLPAPAPDAGRFTLRAFAGDVRHALANRNYVLLLVSMFFLSLMQGVRGGLWIYTATFYWQLSNAQITWFALGSFVSYSCGSLIVAWLHRRFDKRLTGAVAVAVYSVGPAIPLALGWLGVLGSGTPGLLAILIAFSLLQHLPYSLMTTTMYSALADMADENELRFGERQEGVLFSTQTFFARLDQAVGAALAGGVLTLVAFPAGAQPGHVAAPVLAGVALAYIASTLPGLAAAAAYTRVRVTRASYAATRAGLDQSPA